MGDTLSVEEVLEEVGVEVPPVVDGCDVM